MSNVVSVLAVIKFLGATSGVARAQATGTISAIVTDESRASIPGVTIEVTNAEPIRRAPAPPGPTQCSRCPQGRMSLRPCFQVSKSSRDGIGRVGIRMSVDGLGMVTVT